MTDTEKSLVEAVLNWRRNHGACHPHEPGDLREIGAWAEAVIRERNAVARGDAATALHPQFIIGSCREGDRCVCGGDTSAVRAGCHNWIK